jgi:ubiquinone/menaquinone biosynthesis C-methylase UbiE
MHATKRTFIPAAGYDFALPLYDPLTRWLGADGLRGALIAQAALRAGERALDIGCGTGSLAVRAKLEAPGAELVAIDPDPKALTRARRKAARAGVDVQFDRGFGDALPYANGSFAHVFSTFMLHHLDGAARQALLGEAFRVLQPGGMLHVIDFAQPDHGMHGFSRRVARAVLGGRPEVTLELSENLRRAGFSELTVGEQGRMLFQPIVQFRGRVPPR